MTISHWLIVALWLIFIAYWAIAALSAKRSLGAWWKGCGLRLSIIILVLLALRIPPLRQALRYIQVYEAQSVLMGPIGVALCAAGVGLAIWARVHLGRNWGMPASRKEDPELVTTGPYAVIRHPIYAGILLAMVGSAIGDRVYWLLPLILFGAYFIYSARREEKMMTEQFPDQYLAYMQRTKMLLPFVL